MQELFSYRTLVQMFDPGRFFRFFSRAPYTVIMSNFPPNPSCQSFLNIIFIMPAFPVASYRAKGLLIGSIRYIIYAGILSRPFLPSNPVNAV